MASSGALSAFGSVDGRGLSGLALAAAVGPDDGSAPMTTGAAMAIAKVATARSRDGRRSSVAIGRSVRAVQGGRKRRDSAPSVRAEPFGAARHHQRGIPISYR